jgi:hypothetical protein
LVANGIAESTRTLGFTAPKIAALRDKGAVK